MDLSSLGHQAEGLPRRERGIAALLVAWLLEPGSHLDNSEEGAERQGRYADAWLRAWRAIGADDEAVASLIERELSDRDELGGDEEPEGPASFALDFLVAILYAVRAYVGDSVENLYWTFSRADGSLEFLVNEISDPLPLIGLEGLIMSALETLRSGPDVDEIERFRHAVTDASDHLRRSVLDSL